MQHRILYSTISKFWNKKRPFMVSFYLDFITIIKVVF
jgi:hypothetical protein